jgi:hypothetical protein
MEGVKERQLAAAKRERKAAEAKALAEAEELRRQSLKKKPGKVEQVREGRSTTISKIGKSNISSGIKRARSSSAPSKGKKYVLEEDDDDDEEEEKVITISKDRKKTVISSSSRRLSETLDVDPQTVLFVPTSEGCAVCGGFEDEDVENPLVSCDGGGCKAGCTLRVHAECYGVKYLHGADGTGLKSRRSSTSGGGKGEKNSHIDKGNEKVKEDDTIPTSVRAAALSKAAASPEGALTCSLCRTKKYQGSGRHPPPCALCVSSTPSNRAMKRVRTKDPANATSLSALEKEDAQEDTWAHIACALWTPETFFWHPVDKDYIGGVDRIDPKRFKLPCAICTGMGRKIGGAPIQCQSGACSVSFHVLCCREMGWEMVDMEYKSGVLQQSFCGRHSSVDFLKKAAELDAVCVVCRRSSDSESLLLCDHCGSGHHMQCLNPPLRKIPSGAWFCPPCAVKENSKEKSQALLEEDRSLSLSHTHSGSKTTGGGGGGSHNDSTRTTALTMTSKVGFSTMNSYFQNVKRFFPNVYDTPVPPMCDAADVGPSTRQEHTLATNCLQSIAAMLPIASASDVPIIAITGIGNLVLPATALACALGAEVAFWNIAESTATSAILNLRPSAALAVSRFDGGLPGGSGSGLWSSSASSSSKVLALISPPTLCVIVLHVGEYSSSDLLLPLLSVLDSHTQSQASGAPRFKLQLFVVCESNTSLLRLQRTAITTKNKKRIAILDASNFDPDPGATSRFVSQFSSQGETLISERGTAWVLKSLTANHRALLHALADVVTEAQPSISFDSLLSLCNESMIASTDSALRGILSELCDHGIVDLDRKNNLVTLKVPAADIKASC